MNLGTGNRPFLLLFFNSRLRATICQAVRMSAFENTKGGVDPELPIATVRFGATQLKRRRRYSAKFILRRNTL